jgi:dihydroorotase
MAVNPARLLRLDKAGTLAPGAVADVTVVDPNFEWTVNPTRFRSLSRNTPFTGMKVKGKTMLTLVDGIIVFDGRNAGTC